MSDDQTDKEEEKAGSSAEPAQTNKCKDEALYEYFACPPEKFPRDPEDYVVVDIVIVGNSNVGKTSLLKQFALRQFSGTRVSTIGVEFIAVKLFTNHPQYDQPTQARIYDTAGQERFQSLTRQFLRRKNAAVLVFDSSDMSSFSSMRRWRDSVHECAPDAVCVMIGNKVDLYNSGYDSQSRPLTKWLGQFDLAAKAKEFQCEAGLFLCSAKDGTGVDDAIVRAVDLAAKRQIGLNDRLLAADSGRKTNNGVIELHRQSQITNKSVSIKCCSK